MRNYLENNLDHLKLFYKYSDEKFVYYFNYL